MNYGNTPGNIKCTMHLLLTLLILAACNPDEKDIQPIPSNNPASGIQEDIGISQPTVTQHPFSETENAVEIVVGHIRGGKVTEKNVEVALETAGLTKDGKTPFTVTFVPGATSIDEHAFFECTSLTGVVIREGINMIGGFAFLNCTSLTSVELPASVDYIDPYAFWVCPSLTDISVDSDNPHFMSESHVLFNKGKTTLVRYPGGRSGTYSIPDGTVSIRSGAFQGSALTGVAIPDSVTTIERRAFQDCILLTDVMIPKSVTLIPQYAFAYCTSLRDLDIPDNVKAIDTLAFWLCTSLTRIVIPASVTDIDKEAFEGCEPLVIYGDTDSAAHTYAKENGMPFKFI
ncbi:MAG: leucine-rich repeat domain-containing protein [Oscillospiraceae bacterium]|nr:leucine-rich repeat domain-containing protein [Oscillospiraceae bacterium]